MQHAAQAYGAIAKQTANPRELEADLLLTAAARLQAIHDGWDGQAPELDAALVYNRKLWSIFVTSATSPENPLPAGLRQNVANLGLFVFKQTLAIHGRSEAGEPRLADQHQSRAGGRAARPRLIRCGKIRK